MRRSVIVAIATALSLTLVGVALADGFVQNSVIKLTAKKSGKTTGFNANISSTTPTGTKPEVATKLVVTFPSGTKFNLGKFTACKLSDTQIMGGTSCPATSKIGTGSATAVAWPLGLNVNAAVKAYVSGSKEMLVVVTATSPVNTTLVIRQSVSGSKLTIPIPSPTVLGAQVILTSLKLNVPPKGSGTKALAVAGKCASGKFVITSDFSYDDGTSAHVSSTSPCTK